MISNGPSRSFTHQSIESWFLKLSNCEWEKMFSEQSLTNGRKYYKNGTLNGLDISQNQVIFIRKINRQESYSIVEWNGKNILLFGSEGFGIKAQTLNNSDFKFRVNMNNNIESLNISNTVSVVCHHIFQTIK